MLNLVSTAKVLDANDADKWGESSRLSDQSYLSAFYNTSHVCISITSSLHSSHYRWCYQLIWMAAMVFPEFLILLNNPFLLFPSYKHHSFWHAQPFVTIISKSEPFLAPSPTFPFPNYFFLSLYKMVQSCRPFTCLHIHSVPLSLSSSVSFSLLRSLSPRGHQTSLTPSVPPTQKQQRYICHKSVTSSPAGEGDKWGKPQSWSFLSACRMYGWAGDEEEDVRYGQGLMQVNPIREK